MKAPTRALIVEDIATWVYTFNRAARRAGASEVVACESLTGATEALRSARFDVAILDIGLDPDDDQNSDGIKVLEAIRQTDGDGTRCVLVTGWQGGDRMDLQSYAQQKFGVDWAFMKEKYDARSVIAKLTELLEGSAGATSVAGDADGQPRREREAVPASKASCSTRSTRTAGSRPSTRWRHDFSAP